MKKKKWVQKWLGITVMLLCSSGVWADFSDGFESGLGAWTISSGTVQVVTSEAPRDPGLSSDWLPTEGDHFASLLSIFPDTTIYRSFVGLAGETLQFDYYFDAGEKYHHYATETLQLPDLSYLNHVHLEDTAPGWQSISYTLPETGIYMLFFSVRCGPASRSDAVFGVDNVRVVGSVTVPECPSVDLTGDCFIDLADLAVLAEHWLTGNRIPKDLVIIPAGTFQMGNSKEPSEGYPFELPVHTVTLDSFAMSKCEINNGQYCAFLNSTLKQGLIVVTDGIVYAIGDAGKSFPYCETSTIREESQIAFGGGLFSVRTKIGRSMSNDPMLLVTWYGAAAYCNWRSQQEGREKCYDLSTWTCDFTKKGYRLPTEAQWEYAARGGLPANRFPWGDTITHSQANYSSNFNLAYDVSLTQDHHPTWNDGTSPYTSPVGTFSPNGFGLYDMAGNVVEWCNEWLSGSYYQASPSTNPTGPIAGMYRVLRGGSWAYDANHCRVSLRNGYEPYFRYSNLGFRVVLGLDSKGHETASVPNVSGLTQISAEAALIAAGLAVGTVSESFSDSVPAGHVISQAPPAGQFVLPASSVNLVVSKGPEIHP